MKDQTTDTPDGRGQGTRRRLRPFTLVEILIVLVVVGLILAVATPRLMEKSDQMTVDEALNDIRTAVNETAMRSRATGQALTLTLNDELHQFNVAPGGQPLENSWQPPKPELDPEEQQRQASFISAKPTYKFPDEVIWEPEDRDLDEDGNFVITFFPDGQAAARELPFTLCNRRFVLTVDRITAAPTILELTD